MLSHRKQSGFTLIEIILVIVIMGILAAVAMRSGKQIYDTAKTEQTKQELDKLAMALVGNPELQNNGIRTDFGYIGDVGSLPSSLDHLINNPGGYSTWQGPYLTNNYEQVTDDYKRDAWGSLYSYSGGITITSSGSGSNIIRKLANTSSDLTINQVTGMVLDVNGIPPGSIYKDSIQVRLIVPNGTGGLQSKTALVDAGGYFSFDSIPVGNQDISIIYIPASDTLDRFVSVLPNSSPFREYYLGLNYFASGGGGYSGSSAIQYVNSTASTYGGNCEDVSFNITNTSSSAISVSNINIAWSSPVAFYREVHWAGSEVIDQGNPMASSGNTYNFNNSKSIAAGATVTMTIEGFESLSNGSGVDVNMANTDFTVTFSDGSVITFNSGNCP